MTPFFRQRLPLHSPLARRLIIGIVFFSLAATVLLTAIQTYQQYRYAMRNINAELTDVEKVHIAALSQSLWATSDSALHLQLQGLVRTPDFEYAAVRDGSKLWAKAGVRHSAKTIERHYQLTHSLEGKVIPLGTLTVVVGLDGVYHRLIAQALDILLTNGLQIFLLAAFVFVLFHLIVNRHLQTMATYVRNMDLRHSPTPLILQSKRKRHGTDELDELASAINSMRKRTQAALAALQTSEEQFLLATEGAEVGLWDWNLATNALYLSPVLKKQIGYQQNEIRDSLEEWETRMHPEDLPRMRATINDYLTGRNAYLEVEYRLQHKDGLYRWFLGRGALRRDETGRPIRLLGVQVDISKRRQAEEQLGHLAHYDSLTELPNRLLFADRLSQAMIESDRHQRLVGVAFLDLDRFKNVNDTLGHDVGDQLLKAVSQRLIGTVRKGDTVARLSGDEFTLILADMAHVDDAARVAQKILDAFAMPFHVLGRDLYITASLGITLYPFDVEDVSGLLRNADIAMYRAKEQGRNTYQFYAADMMTKAVENLALENDLRQVFERKELVLHYQPIVRCQDEMVIGMEALVRWRHPLRGLIPPSQFIPLAEDLGLIIQIGEWVLHEACAQCQHWRQEFQRPLNVAVNLSARQFSRTSISDTVKAALQDTGLDPTALELEITESTLLHQDVDRLQSLNTLSEMGITLTIDDFGTGYSSLSYLKRFPVDVIKIDQSFTHDIPNDADDAALARAIVHMAHALGLKTVVEGVETRAQMEFFRLESCDAAQGFYFSKPLPPEEFADLLQQHYCPINDDGQRDQSN